MNAVVVPQVGIKLRRNDVAGENKRELVRLAKDVGYTSNSQIVTLLNNAAEPGQTLDVCALADHIRQNYFTSRRCGDFSAETEWSLEDQRILNLFAQRLREFNAKVVPSLEDEDALAVSGGGSSASVEVARALFDYRRDDLLRKGVYHALTMSRGAFARHCELLWRRVAAVAARKALGDLYICIGEEHIPAWEQVQYLLGGKAARGLDKMEDVFREAEEGRCSLPYLIYGVQSGKDRWEPSPYDVARVMEGMGLHPLSAVEGIMYALQAPKGTFRLDPEVEKEAEGIRQEGLLQQAHAQMAVFLKRNYAESPLSQRWNFVTIPRRRATLDLLGSSVGGDRRLALRLGGDPPVLEATPMTYRGAAIASFGWKPSCKGRIFVE